jgi:quercetin dioxygenase-like cupin family protein
MYRYIEAPALALSGEFDLNVPPEHAGRAVEIMREAGNRNADAMPPIANTDHSFQQAAGSEAERMRERYTLESFRRPYQPLLYQAVLKWLREVLPSPLPADLESLDAIAAAAVESQARKIRAEKGPELEPMGEFTPERTHLAPGVEIVEAITDREKTSGVETLEGRIGPLILGDGCQAHFIDMPGGMYVEEHPHSSESLIYTVRGNWVLCSSGRRRVMKPGSLFRFAAGKPTGYEVPYSEAAFILIFKGDRLSKSEKEFIDYLRGMKERLLEEQKQGIPYLLKDLPEDHPARRYAREVNPDFERALKRRS